MDRNNYKIFIDQVIATLYDMARVDPKSIKSCKSGDDFELCVVEAAKTALIDLGIVGEVFHKPGSHAFPDIVIQFDDGVKFGIEVKSSTAVKSKGWKINGNSVMGSTRDETVVETYIVFGKTAALEFKARKYDDCIANVVVTHSPRYLIDMDLPENETFFDASGISYDELTTSDNPIGLITRYFQSQGQKAWWLAESTPAAVRLFSSMSDTEQKMCIGYGFAHFPELFKRNNSKYKRLATWLATEMSVVSPCLRDDFSASGKVDLIVGGCAYQQLPHIFKTLYDSKDYMIQALNNAESESLCEDWGIPCCGFATEEEKVRAWITVASSMVATSQLDESIRPIDLLYNIFSEYK